MRNRRLNGLAYGLIAMLAGWSGAAWASPVSSADLSGGGATWTSITNTVHGLGVTDANIAGQSDAYDNGLTVNVDGQVYSSPTPFDLSGQTVTGGIATLSGLNIQTQYWADTASPTLRTLVTVANPTGNAIAATVSLLTNVGSDGSTQTTGTSSGDLVFTASDHWIVTDDSTTGGDPANTHVLFGAGGLAPFSVGQTVFSSAGTEGIRADFSLNVNAGDSIYLLFFNQIHGASADALASAPSFEALTTNSPLLTGLGSNQLSKVANWNFNTSNVPEPSTLCLTALGGLALRFRYRQPKLASRA